MDKAFIESIENKAREKEKKAKDKSQRGMARKQKKAARDACEEEWRQIKDLHDRAVEAWKAECEKLKEAKTQLRESLKAKASDGGQAR